MKVTEITTFFLKKLMFTKMMKINFCFVLFLNETEWRRPGRPDFLEKIIQK